MIRAAIEAALVFLIPFALYAGFLALGRRNPLLRAHWDGRTLALVAAGLGCVILSFLAGGLIIDRHTQVFEPAHMENGRVVPGRFH